MKIQQVQTLFHANFSHQKPITGSEFHYPQREYNISFVEASFELFSLAFLLATATTHIAIVPCLIVGEEEGFNSIGGLVKFV